ncbi:hypothetical protein A2442_03630 [Candidatus Campbellbacteria bacterium RIFOXYC2_FULL_35_25]|uniref:Uncharacterized protein n=1 Tax=Candidatus Campbellbacteria bacterium RIFOXYC2_FULL_35_25 TaxID=1797582 RepID=A0A1F5EKB7_9BACT|nr:MAG: hypothetical protein A2442_03630 [Candidatus Campbellbacteria bacterium RIFOXYC2_FULL_35_25]
MGTALRARIREISGSVVPFGGKKTAIEQMSEEELLIFALTQTEADERILSDTQTRSLMEAARLSPMFDGTCQSLGYGYLITQ